jgi:hypothetical protein
MSLRNLFNTKTTSTNNDKEEEIYKEKKKDLLTLNTYKECDVRLIDTNVVENLLTDFNSNFFNLQIMESISCVIDSALLNAKTNEHGILTIFGNNVDILNNKDVVAVRHAVSKDKDTFKAQKKALVNHDYVGLKFLNPLRNVTSCFQYIFSIYHCDNGNIKNRSYNLGNTGIVCSGDHNLYSFEENTNGDNFLISDLLPSVDEKELKSILFMLIYSIWLAHTQYLTQKIKIKNFNLDKSKIKFRKLDTRYEVPIVYKDEHNHDFISKIFLQHIPIITQFDSCEVIPSSTFKIDDFITDVTKLSDVNIKFEPLIKGFIGSLNTKQARTQYNVMDTMLIFFKDILNQEGCSKPNKDCKIKKLSGCSSDFCTNTLDKLRIKLIKNHENWSSNEAYKLKYESYISNIKNGSMDGINSYFKTGNLLYLFYDGSYENPKTIDELLSELLHVKDEVSHLSEKEKKNVNLFNHLETLKQTFNSLLSKHINNEDDMNDSYQNDKLKLYLCGRIYNDLRSTLKLDIDQNAKMQTNELGSHLSLHQLCFETKECKNLSIEFEKYYKQ